jgi:ABC-2 type transport system permease protein
MTATVASSTSIAVTYRVVLRQLVTTGRILALSCIGLAVMVLGWAVGNNDQADETIRLEDAVGVVSLIAFTIVVPIVALVFASASLGDAREDGTLVYLWLRPMRRWTVVVGAWLASLTVSIPLTVVPATLTAVLLDVGNDLVVATVIASTVGVVAYAALFVLLGLIVKNSIVWGLGYIVIWEGLVATFGSSAARVAVRGYTSSILTDRTGVDLELGGLSQTVGIIVPLVIGAWALAFAAFRLETLEVA